MSKRRIDSLDNVAELEGFVIRKLNKYAWRRPHTRRNKKAVYNKKKRRLKQCYL